MRMSVVATPATGATSHAFLNLPNSWILEGLDADFQKLLLGELESINLPGGQTLFEEGQPPDAMYLVTSGILGVVVGKPIERSQLIAQIHAGETVGEMALFSQRPRPSAVIALRDSSLLRLRKETFANLIDLNPRAMPRLAASLVDRLENTTHNLKTASAPKTIALL